MKITILHVRDPDGACNVTVFVDGVEQNWQEVDMVDIDAGRGYTLEDWEENIAWAEQMPASPLRDAVLEAYGNPPGSEYIVGWGDREEEHT